jgi:uncharacterized protein YkwD
MRIPPSRFLRRGAKTTALALALFMALAPALTVRTALGQTKDTPGVDPAPAQAQPKNQQQTQPAGSQPLECPFSFTDVHNPDYFYGGVGFLFCRGAIGGYSDGSFRPGAPTTRAQFSKMVAVANGWTLINPSQPSFNDVPPTHAFYTYIETAKSRGVVNGYSDGSFHPDALVTRGQLAKMLVTSEGWQVLEPPAPRFNDVPPGSPCDGYVEAAVYQGAVNGYADGSFRPGLPTTRGQVSKVLYYSNLAPLTPREVETIDLINTRRALMGLNRLNISFELSAAGRRHSYDIGPAGLCQHDGTDGSSPWQRAADAGYTGFAMGEVVGCGYPTSAEVVQGWWDSPGHFGVLTGATAVDIGCGWWLNDSGYGWQTCMTGQP